jgi:hypothetical protein
MPTPRPTLRLVHPLDRCQRLEPRQSGEGAQPAHWDHHPSESRTIILWDRVLTWALVLVMGVTFWYGLLGLLWWCCA